MTNFKTNTMTNIKMEEENVKVIDIPEKDQRHPPRIETVASKDFRCIEIH